MRIVLNAGSLSVWPLLWTLSSPCGWGNPAVSDHVPLGCLCAHSLSLLSSSFFSLLDTHPFPAAPLPPFWCFVLFLIEIEFIYIVVLVSGI